MTHRSVILIHLFLFCYYFLQQHQRDFGTFWIYFCFSLTLDQISGHRKWVRLSVTSLPADVCPPDFVWWDVYDPGWSLPPRLSHATYLLNISGGRNGKLAQFRLRSDTSPSAGKSAVFIFPPSGSDDKCVPLKSRKMAQTGRRTSLPSPLQVTDGRLLHQSVTPRRFVSAWRMLTINADITLPSSLPPPPTAYSGRCRWRLPWETRPAWPRRRSCGSTTRQVRRLTGSGGE